MGKASSGRKKTGRSGEPTRSRETAKQTRVVRKKTAATTRPTGVSPPATDITRVHVWQIQAVRDLLWVAAVFGVVWLGYLLQAITVPLLVALLLAYLFEPLVARWSQRPGWSRAKVLAVMLSTGGVVLALIVAIGATLAVNQASRLARDIESGRFRARLANVQWPEVMHEPYHNLLERMWPSPDEPVTDQPTPAEPVADEAAESTPPPIVARPALTETRVREIVREEAQRDDGPSLLRAGGWRELSLSPAAAASGFLRVAGSILQAGFLLFLIPFYFFFFSLWYVDVTRFAGDLIPTRNRASSVALLGKMDRAVAGFVRGRLVISAIMGMLLAIGWMICGVPYSIALGFIVGVFCAIPYLGGIGIPLAVLLLWFDSIGPEGTLAMSWWQIILWPTLVFAIVQLIEGYVLTPMIAGKATNLDPVTILVAVLAGGALMGVYGMLLAIPIAACLKILATDVLLPKVKAWTEGLASDPLPIERD